MSEFSRSDVRDIMQLIMRNARHVVQFVDSIEGDAVLEFMDDTQRLIDIARAEIKGQTDELHCRYCDEVIGASEHARFYGMCVDCFVQTGADAVEVEFDDE